jgi:hypothetical protein
MAENGMKGGQAQIPQKRILLGRNQNKKDVTIGDSIVVSLPLLHHLHQCHREQVQVMMMIMMTSREWTNMTQQWRKGVWYRSPHGNNTRRYNIHHDRYYVGTIVWKDGRVPSCG